MTRVRFAAMGYLLWSSLSRSLGNTPPVGGVRAARALTCADARAAPYEDHSFPVWHRVSVNARGSGAHPRRRAR
ncbi:hypothetical protein GCM10010245_50250 [Streptomyces spectabilis]|nr:hypothetical protein GCM10010245_50250 [Streptomyces spectabilis]